MNHPTIHASKYKKQNTAVPQGFTLIELLVSIALISILVTAGITAYTRAQQRQVVRASINNLSNTLDEYHQKALVGTRPTNCVGTFRGYRITTAAGSGQLTATPLCQDGNGTPSVETINHLSFSANYSFTFLPLNAGISLGGASLNLDYQDDLGGTQRFVLTKSGTIEYQGEVE